MNAASQPPHAGVTPPFELTGLTLPTGWTIGSRIEKKDGETGGSFSVGYECTSANGVPGFLKAIDLYKPLLKRGGDVLKALQPYIQEVQGERDLLAECRSMDRVISALDTGDIVELRGTGLLIPIPYIIFERALANARNIVLANARPNHGWCLRTLHQVAVGLWQMHGSMIAHQDLKLSNLLLFGKERGAQISDLGRAVQQGRSVPHDLLEWPGDRGYAPPEYAYGYTPSEFNVRRLAADLYLLGSCASSMTTGASINALLYDELPRDFHPRWQKGSYTGTFEDVVPHLRDAFERVLNRIDAAIPADAPHRVDLVGMIREWCDPDPRDRGHPRTRAQNSRSGNIYSLERYLSKLDLLATRVSVYERVSVVK